MAVNKLFEQAAHELGIDAHQVERVIELLDAGSSPLFIARYRPDDAGGADAERVAAIRDAVRRRRMTDERRSSILRLLEGQRKLTDELRDQIAAADCLDRLDDLYHPFKPKPPSQATEARDRGLGPLADEILTEAPAAADLDSRAADFVNEDRKVADAASALAGAGRILAERFSEDTELRRQARRVVRKTGKLVSKRADGASDKKAEAYKTYLDYREALTKAPPHRVLAINRGERAGVLRVGVEANVGEVLRVAKERLAPPTHAHAELLAGCVHEAVTAILMPALEQEARRRLNEQAETHALEVFARNLRNLLLGAPLPGKRIVAIDPGYQNGCRVAAIDAAGAVLATGQVAVVGEEEQRAAGRRDLAAIVDEHHPDLIAIGNGKACRPAEELVASLLAEEWKDRELSYLIVSEAGANVYAGSTTGREELPDLDQQARGAVSIARRVQDPLQELVKIDPASVGVGLYQHDAKSKPMRDALEEVVRECVGHVGVDANTATASLLRYVPGLNQLSARRLCEHRAQHGPLKRREQLREIGGVGEAAYKQAAGFLKIAGGDCPLDATWIHPESYPVAEKLLALAGVDAEAVATPEGAARFAEAMKDRDPGELATELGVGPLAAAALVAELSGPGRDPRSDLPPPAFRRGVVRFEDLAKGTELEGRVLNVVDFGAFVDVGLSDSGLLHISRMSSSFVASPHEVVAVGDRVRVWVDSVEADRKRVSLTMIEPGTEPPAGKEKPSRQRGSRSKPKDKGAESRSGSDKPKRRDKPKKPRGKRHDQPPRERSRTYEVRAKGPPKPITQEMEEGKEAMRTFGDLLQFHKKKAEGGDSGPDA